MSLKRRNLIAWVLLFTAAICWVSSTRYRQYYDGNAVEETTYAATGVPGTEEAIMPSEGVTIPGDTEPSETGSVSKTMGLVLGFASVLLAAAAVFAFRQKAPILGPDGLTILAALIFWIQYNRLSADYVVFRGSAQDFLMTMAGSLMVFAVLLLIREGWGWIRSGFSLSWCAVYRIARRCQTSQFQLLTFAGWIAISTAASVFGLIAMEYLPVSYIVPLVCPLVSAALAVICLWCYGLDLNHFRKQLQNYQKGLPVPIQEGAFGETEKKLLEVQAQHEEAVRTAVTSERFKVELISNVSHDLRTPLTSILGYSELLQKETLTPEGQEQLRRLHQKAGYMNDLVESLFELTKVSSGVAESKKDEIDLIRLLEQTIGLFDDQLNTANLVVRRHYTSDSMIVVTDGARMHQVFANLLTNAIKYALPGTRIHLEVTETDENYRVRMVNTASYEMDFRPEEIVQRFARGDKARSTKGSGLGLAIAQTYTESVGGSFRVTIDGDQFSAIVELPKS